MYFVISSFSIGVEKEIEKDLLLICDKFYFSRFATPLFSHILPSLLVESSRLQLFLSRTCHGSANKRRKKKEKVLCRCSEWLTFHFLRLGLIQPSQSQSQLLFPRLLLLLLSLYIAFDLFFSLDRVG